MILQTKRFILRPWHEDDIDVRQMNEIRTSHVMLMTRETWEKGRENGTS